VERIPIWWSRPCCTTLLKIKKFLLTLSLVNLDRRSAIVAEVTDDKTVEKAERKRRQVASAHKKSDQAKMLKLADKTSNLRAIAVSPPPDWSVKRRLEYIDWAKSVVAGLRGVSPGLEEQFDRAAEDAERSVAVATPRAR
jgi:hypothetical protein